MGAKPKGLVSRRAVRERLPEAYRTAAHLMAPTVAVMKWKGGDAAAAFYLALREVMHSLERKAQQLDAGRSG